MTVREFLCLHSKHVKSPLPSFIIIGNGMLLSTQAKNLRVIFDDTPSLRQHRAATCKSAFFHLHRISRILWFLTKSATKTLVHFLISIQLDYCNSALCGLPEFKVNKLQCVKKCCCTFCDVHRLAELHWLPIWSRILFKIVDLSY